MAQQVQVTLVDDIDGGDADETLTFGLDGSTYEIDLSEANAKGLRDSLAPYVEAGRKATGKKGKLAPVSRAHSKQKSREIREWAKEHGKQVNERGRIPAAIVAEYEAAS